MTTNNQNKILPKPAWIRSQLASKNKIAKITTLLRNNQLNTVCEEAACPNRGECFSHGTATFMLMGNKCTRNCGFCNVLHKKPEPLDIDEPEKLAITIKAMQLKYVVITSVTRDDLADGGAQHFALCIKKIRALNSKIKIEILTPDFRGCLSQALDIFASNLPDVFNHNIETVPRLYRNVCPQADYQLSLKLLTMFKARFPKIPTKSGLMLGLGETNKEVVAVLRDLRSANVERLTLGQYLQPSLKHLPVERYVTPEEFARLALNATRLGFKHIASAPMVRSSYHADV